MDKLTLIALTAVALTLGSSCQSEDPPAAGPAAPSGASETVHAQAPATGIAGQVVETMDSGNYTYVLIDTGSEQVWAATSPVPVNVGDEVTIANPLEQINFHAPSLDRTFERIIFTDSIFPGSQAAAGHGGMMPAGHGAMGAASDEPATVTGVDRAEGGVTVEEVFLKKEELIGSEIVIRGQVVKYNAAILGVNWLHVQDGTGSPGTNDLTITTAATANLGDVVTIRGTLVADKDFGAGYQYELIVEDAEVTVE